MIYRELLLRYLVRPVFILLLLICSTAGFLKWHPRLDTDMPSNLFVGIWATVLVWGFTVARSFFTESIPVLKRAWIFKGNRRLNVAYAAAVPAIAATGPGASAANLTIVFAKPPSPSMPPWPGVFTIPRPVPDSELRAFKYLVKGFPETDFDFIPDTDALNSDVPFVALGSEGSNYCTNQVMMSLGFGPVGAGSSASAILTAAVHAKPSGFEYGVIAITNANGRLAIACWGLGVTGTSGAALFLARSQRVLAGALEGDYDTGFVALLKFPLGQDTNGELVGIYRPNQISTFASRL